MSSLLSCSSWTGVSTFNGTARMTFNPLNASLTVASNAVLDWTSGDVSGALTVAAGGTLTISNGVSLSNFAPGGVLTNNGTVVWAATSGSYLYGYGGSVIYNAGLWQATADDSILNANSGTNFFYNTGTFQKIGGSGATAIGWRMNTTGTINTTTGSLTCSSWIGVSTLNGTARMSLSPLNASLTVASNSVLDWTSGDVSGALTCLKKRGFDNIPCIFPC